MTVSTNADGEPLALVPVARCSQALNGTPRATPGREEGVHEDPEPARWADGQVGKINFR